MCDDHHEDCYGYDEFCLEFGHGVELDDPDVSSFVLRFEQASHHATRVSSCRQSNDVKTDTNDNC